EEREQHPDDRDGNFEKIPFPQQGEGIIAEGDGTPFRVYQRQAPIDRHRRQGGDKGGHPPLGHQQPVGNPHQGTGRHAREKGQDRVRSPGDHSGAEGTGQGQNGADRQVDASGQDHEGHPEGQQGVNGNLPQNIENIGDGQKIFADDGQDDDDDTEAHEGTDFLEQPPPTSGFFPKVVHDAYPPDAAARIFSWVASSLANSAVIRPWYITSTRSLIPSTSGRSEEMSRIAIPSRVRRFINRYISSLAPMSTPRVGSSRMSTRGEAASHLPMTTFC